jgi:benzoate-CoA ligase
MISSADHSVSPPRIDIPREYNAAVDLIERNLRAGRADKAAYFDARGAHTYAQLARRVDRFASALQHLGVRMEERVLLCLLDGIDFPVAFLGCIKAGVVPVPVNTLLTTNDYEFMLHDSRARMLVVSEALLPSFAPLLAKLPLLEHVIVSGLMSGISAQGQRGFEEFLASGAEKFTAAPTTRDDVCFWLYTSGSTGKPKGAVHIHSSLIQTAELYAKPILGIRESDVVFSAAKLFFAYGLGNALTFPLAVGASAVLLGERPTPASVAQILRQHRPTIFYGVPTLFAALLASDELPRREELNLRICTSAGEALPADIGKRWRERFGVDILDGIGSTEMLHIFLSNRPGEVRDGSTGKPVAGYDIRLVDEAGKPAAVGEIGELQVHGASSATQYWNNRARSVHTFLGPWTRSGDKYVQEADGYYTYCGRSDDMLKVGGQYVAPFEVEAALMSHAAVLEAAVVGAQDEHKLTKPKAFIVLKPGHAGGAALIGELQQHVKDKLAPFKYPRWIEFVADLPKTATGKIQRFKLRR